jgi:hypothetical protein
MLINSSPNDNNCDCFDECTWDYICETFCDETWIENFNMYYEYWNGCCNDG